MANNRVLTDKQKEEMREKRKHGAKIKELVEMYGVSRQTVCRYTGGCVEGKVYDVSTRNGMQEIAQEWDEVRKKLLRKMKKRV